MKKLTTLLALILMTIQMATAQVAGHDYARVVCEECDVNVDDSLFYEIARSVTFPVNKYDIPKESDFYHELIEDIIPQMNDGNYRLEHIIMRGAASPDGPTGWNTVLAEKRQKALFNLLQQNLNSTSLEAHSTKSEVPEDYNYLVKMMRDNEDVDAQRVAEVVEKYSNDQALLKRELKRMDGGHLWRRMLKEYFPQLRSARVVLVFVKNHVEINAQTPVLTLPEVDVNKDLLNDKLDLNVKAPKVVVEEVKGRREMLSVKTNLLMDFAYMPSGYDRFCSMPNVGIEYYPKNGHFTFGASFDIPWHQDYDAHKFFQARNYQIESRYYFRNGGIKNNPVGKGAAYRGFYLQGYGHAAKYGIMFTANRGWVGEGIGGGVGLGYVLPLTKAGHLRLEFGAQFGYFYTRYDPFQYECPVDPTEHDNLYYYKWTLDADLFRERQYVFTWIGPTKVGVTLTYDLLYRKNKKKGISFRSWESR